MADNSWLLALKQMDPNAPGGVYEYQMKYLKDNVPPEEWNAAVQKGWITQDGKPLNIPTPGGRQQSDANWNVDSTKFIDQHQDSWEAMDTYDDPVYGKMTSRKTPSLESSRKMNIWGPLAALGPGLIGGGLALAGGAGAAGAAGAGAAGSAGVPGSIYGGLGSAGAGFGTEIAGGAAAAGAGGGAVGGSAGGSALSGIGSSITGMGKDVVGAVASALGISPDKAREIISGLGSTGIQAILGGGSGGGSGGSAGGNSGVGSASWWELMNANRPNQTNAYGDTVNWGYDPTTGKWTEKSSFSPERQAIYDQQIGMQGKNVNTASQIDLSGYSDPNKQFAASGEANPYKTKLPSMGGNLIPWDYKSQLPGTGG